MRAIVDGMNVIGSRPDGWWKDRRRGMVALVDRLECWAAEGDDVYSGVLEATAVVANRLIVDQGRACAWGGPELGRRRNRPAGPSRRLTAGDPGCDLGITR